MRKFLNKNTKIKGNKAESVILAEFVKHEIPVLLPFGDNEKFDLVIFINNEFKSVQVKYGRYVNGCVVADGFFKFYRCWIFERSGFSDGIRISMSVPNDYKIKRFVKRVCQLKLLA